MVKDFDSLPKALDALLKSSDSTIITKGLDLNSTTTTTTKNTNSVPRDVDILSLPLTFLPKHLRTPIPSLKLKYLSKEEIRNIL